MGLPALLLIEGEEPIRGEGRGAEAPAAGVMSVSALAAGFPDVLTDPFYTGKILCFTYPHVGTPGVVPDDLQSDAVAARAVVAKEVGTFAANRLGTESMEDFLVRNGIPAVTGVDTRAITEIVRRRGAVRAVVGTGKHADAALLAQTFGTPGAFDIPPAGVAEPRDWPARPPAGAPAPVLKILVYDFGVKRGFLRRLSARGCAVKLVPSNFPAIRALAEKPDGIVFSAGSGTPETRAGALAPARDLLEGAGGSIPLWGVGVGAGVLAAAAGAAITVDGRGHAGAHPVGRAGTPSGEITAQCHDFWIDAAGLAAAGFEQTHGNLNDGTVEGFRCARRNIMGVLFHPEAEPGQRDSLYLFDRFHDMMTLKRK